MSDLRIAALQWPCVTQCVFNLQLLRLRAKRARASQRLAAKGKGTTGSSANLVPRRFANTPPVDVELLGQFQSVKSFEQRSAAAVRAARFKQ